MTSEAVAQREVTNIVTVMINQTIGHSFKILRVEVLPSATSHADRLLSKSRDVKKNLENIFFIREKREYCYSIKNFNTAWIFYKLFCRECNAAITIYFQIHLL